MHESNIDRRQKMRGLKAAWDTAACRVHPAVSLALMPGLGMHAGPSMAGKAAIVAVAAVLLLAASVYGQGNGPTVNTAATPGTSNINKLVPEPLAAKVGCATPPPEIAGAAASMNITSAHLRCMRCRNCHQSLSETGCVVCSARRPPLPVCWRSPPPSR